MTEEDGVQHTVKGLARGLFDAGQKELPGPPAGEENRFQALLAVVGEDVGLR